MPQWPTDEIGIGTVKLFSATRGYGFILPADNGPDVMFHGTGCRIMRNVEIVPGLRVRYAAYRTEGGRMRASSVEPVEREPVCPCCGARRQP